MKRLPSFLCIKKKEEEKKKVSCTALKEIKNNFLEKP